jgi:predicted nucleic-acid-binding Zn-ribbon protein
MFARRADARFNHEGHEEHEGGQFMPPEFYITCPKCGHRYNVHKMIYDEGEDFSMFCPVCTARYPRKEGKIDGANFDIKK